eukprot:2462740-Rhodomonas_salina.1
MRAAWQVCLPSPPPPPPIYARNASPLRGSAPTSGRNTASLLRPLLPFMAEMRPVMAAMLQ